jgi:membrane protein implicated in regulation of membrane protease activity
MIETLLGSAGLSLGPWAWLAAAAVLMMLELALPGAFMLWLGLAAALTGLVAFTTDLGWPAEVLVFAVAGIVFALIGRRVMRARTGSLGENGFLNRRADAFVGREFVLAEPIVGGAGRVRVEDTVWRVSGADMAAGTRVRVTGVDGATLQVAAAG